MNQTIEQRLVNLRRAPRCGARNRAGHPCKRPALRGKARCRLHGGLSSGAPGGEGNGRYRDGYWTKEAISERKWLRELVRSHTSKDADQ